jgi:tRNA modification GTPase
MIASNDDTIGAISTPLGEGGIGIVRLSGKDALRIVERIFSSPKNKTLSDQESHCITYGRIHDPETGTSIDEVLVTIMKSPASYTREDVVEINCHGGMVPLRETFELVLRYGARMAEPGEFTKRAFLNGRIDLSQAEAVLDLIRAKSEESRRIALEQLQGGLSKKITELRDDIARVCAQAEVQIDFPEDEIEPASETHLRESTHRIEKELEDLGKTFREARFFREGLSTTIVGRPNVGKSSLLNSLLKRDRAIVTDIPGTTRDVLEEYLNIHGLPLRIMDTAGIRDVSDAAEREGVSRSLSSIEHADLVIALFDSSEPLNDQDLRVLDKIRARNALIVLNKSDLSYALNETETKRLRADPRRPVLHISATRGDGLDLLKTTIFESCLKDWKEEREGIVVSNLRHKTAIEHARSALTRARNVLTGNQPLEFLALEYRDALDHLGEIVGTVTADDILDMIFNDFCIGK